MSFKIDIIKKENKKVTLSIAEVYVRPIPNHNIEHVMNVENYIQHLSQGKRTSRDAYKKSILQVVTDFVTDSKGEPPENPEELADLMDIDDALAICHAHRPKKAVAPKKSNSEVPNGDLAV